MAASARVLSFVVMVCGLPVGYAQTPASASVTTTSSAARPSYESDPKFVKAMADVKQLIQQNKGAYLEDAYKKANKIAGGQCADCLTHMYNMQMVRGAYKDALASATASEALATTPLSKAIAAADRGEAMVSLAGTKPKPAQLEEAHVAFQVAIALYPKFPSALYADGKVLAKLGRLEEARTDFQQCLECSGPHDPARLRAQHFAANPELATHQMAPAFEVTALDGTKFNLDAMGGRVVLIDFWATWCGPCNEELPHMKKIAKEFAGQPLVILSVSWDSDDATWKTFMTKNEMTWMQYRDADHRLTNEFGVNAIPHYFTIDSDGVLTSEMMGSGSDVEGKLKKLVAKAREAQAAQSASAGGSTQTPLPKTDAE